MFTKKDYVYPKSWNDDDIIKYKYYFNEAKKMYDMPDDLIALCCERQIMEEKGILKPIDFDKYKNDEEIALRSPSASINA
jgi:hypothetical protein